MWKDNYTTDDELQWLERIAHNRDKERALGTLRGYLMGAKDRHDWGSINSTQVKNYARALIAALRPKAEEIAA